jgi:hypothetical protein
MFWKKYSTRGVINELVFGAHILEYKCNSHRKSLTNAQKMISMTGKFMDPSGYFQYVAKNVKKYWQDLNIGDVLIMPFTYTHKNHMTLIISFTYNKEFNIRKISSII